MAPKKYNWINICIFALIITYIYYKVTFSAGVGWGLVIFTIISLFLGWCIVWRILDIAKLINGLSEALTPRSAAGSLEMIGIYYGAGLLFLLLALFGPWFLFEGDWMYEGDDLFQSLHSGEIHDQDYGLWSGEIKTYNYTDWDVYDTDIEKLAYSENSDQFKEREAVAFITLILVVAGMGIMAIPNAIFLLLTSRDLIGRGPAIKDLRNLKNIQDKLNLLWRKLTSLQEKNISITGLIPLIEKIEKNIPAKVRLTKVPIRDQKFVKCIAAVSATAIIVGLAAGLYFGEEWPDAMEEDTCNMGDCSVVQGFSGSDTSGDTPGTGSLFDACGSECTYTYHWGGGWARTLVLFIEPLIMSGILYNCVSYIRLSERQRKAYFNLESSTQDFEKPDFSRFFEEDDVHT